jgi:hypothetical protein
MIELTKERIETFFLLAHAARLKEQALLDGHDLRFSVGSSFIALLRPFGRVHPSLILHMCLRSSCFYPYP